MQSMSVSQLLQLTKSEIFDLRDYLERALPALPAGSPERDAVEQTLRNIGRVLARPEFRTCHYCVNVAP
ncbi:MAG: hypothetical protein P4M05_36310 [Bradyrhizobium sp.]|nr:hypothetical protein [Bradyrhizobium sp.]